MSLTFADLKQELADRGFSDLTEARRERYINAARAELDRMFLWPWREKSVTGSAPLEITDLGTIEAVFNTTQDDFQLERMDYGTLVRYYQDLSVTGTAWAYYIGWPEGAPVVATFPTTTDTIGVQYWKITPDLEVGADVPVSPAEAHYVIVDLAVRRAYRDSGSHDQARAIQQEIDVQVDQLREQYPPGVADGGFVLPADWD